MSELTTSSLRSPLQPSQGTDPVSTRLIELGVAQKLEHLLAAVKGKGSALILTHDNPDPDSLASAVALQHLLERRAGSVRRNHRQVRERGPGEGAPPESVPRLGGDSG